jgi:hypothetical protein
LTPVPPSVAVVVAAITAPFVPAPVAGIGPAGIAGNITDLTIEPAAAPIAPIVPAAIRTVSAAITAILDAVDPAVSAALDSDGAAIAAIFYPVSKAIGAAIHPDRCAIAPTPIKLIGAEIALLLNLVSAPFGPAVNLIHTHFAAPVDTLGAPLAAAIDLCSAFRLTHTIGDLIAETAVGPGIWPRLNGFRRFCLWGSGALRRLPLGSRLAAVAAVLDPLLLAFGTRLRPRFEACVRRILRDHRSGREGQGQRGGQSPQRTTLGKKVHHHEYLQFCRPTTSS